MHIDNKYAVDLFFPTSFFSQIYFEAVANAFDAGATKVDITIVADGKIEPELLEITILDNGNGFTTERFERFQKLEKPQDSFHKGLGRLVFLKYFSKVDITSNFGESVRDFSFSESFTGESKTSHTSNKKKSTTLKFKDFSGTRLKAYNDLKPSAIKKIMLEHFLPLFFDRKKRGLDFNISIDLQIKAAGSQASNKLFPDLVSISHKDIPDFEQKKVHFESKIYLLDDDLVKQFSQIVISYYLEEVGTKGTQLTAFSVDNRTIPLSVIPKGSLPENYTAIFIFDSPLFTGSSDSTRQRLALPESVSYSDLVRLLRQKISVILEDNFPLINKKNEETQVAFEDKYPHLQGLFEKETVGLINADEALEIAQKRFFSDQKQVLNSTSLDEKTFLKSLELSSRVLTEYVLYRQFTIRKLAQMHAENLESEIHDLIVPRYNEYKSSDLINNIYCNNAWLLDDKFMSFKTILSEKRMDLLIEHITLEDDQSKDNGRPDISMIFSADPDETEKVDVVIVEIKRRKSNEKENLYASAQLLKRARKLITHCPNIQRVWFFGVIDIDDDLALTLQDQKWIPLFSKDRVFYQDFPITIAEGKTALVPVTLLSFDAIIKDAEVRNNTFLEILKDGLKQSSLKNTC